MENSTFKTELAQAKAHGNVSPDIITLFEEGETIAESSITKIYYDNIIKTRPDGSEYTPRVLEMEYNDEDVITFSYNSETNSFILPKVLKDKEEIQINSFLYLFTSYLYEYYIKISFDFTPFEGYLELEDFIFGEYQEEEK